MIDEEATLEIHGYRSTDLSPFSHKPVIWVCEVCGGVRVTRKERIRELCPSCAATGEKNPMFGKTLSNEAKKLISEANTGANHWNFGKHRSDAVRKKISDNHADFRGEKSSLFGKHHTPEHIKKNRQAHIGKKLPPRSEEHKHKISKANKGKTLTEETKHKIGDAKRGKPRSEASIQKMKDTFAREGHPFLGKHHNAESNEKNRQKHVGKTLSEEHKQHISAGLMGVSYEEWDGYAAPDKYCYKFDERCRESNRNRYDNQCFICGKTELENGALLSVHHVGRDKNMGCEGIKWRLVPLCKVCHPSSHNAVWDARINYLLDNQRYQL